MDSELPARLPPVGPLTLRTCEGKKPELYRVVQSFLATH